MNTQSPAPLMASIGATGYAVHISAGLHTLSADEPASHGGQDSGPDPFVLLLASLASCILITVRMYASRKSWPLEGIDATLHPTRDAAKPLEAVRVELTLKGPLDDEQRARLIDVASRCPVHRTLEHGVKIETVAA